MTSGDEIQWRQDIAVGQIRGVLAEHDRGDCTDADVLADVRSTIEGLEHFGAMPGRPANGGVPAGDFIARAGEHHYSEAAS